MGNPLRSEADAFRWLVVIVAAAAAVIALALLTRPLFGALLGLVFFVLVTAAASRALIAWHAAGAEGRAAEAEEERRLLARVDGLEDEGD
ncbi:MAG: hypothetical protein QOJ38_381 [Solirubrobacterales bacterium]|jgi:hypothetical protein|nr:hypothetical protein [Solirubrobacterales bacterium]